MAAIIPEKDSTGKISVLSFYLRGYIVIVLGQGETDPLSVLSVREHTLKSYLIQLSHPGKATWKGEPMWESRGSRWKLVVRRGPKHQPTASGGNRWAAKQPHLARTASHAPDPRTTLAMT